MEAFPSIAAHPNQRWATDIAMVNWGDKGVCAFVSVIDCCTREILGWALESTARTLEEALLTRFGWTYGAPKGLMLRHDNGLVFGSKTYPALVKDYGISQEYTAPYTPVQNGLCERFIRSFKEECAWITSFAEARAKIATISTTTTIVALTGRSTTSPQTNTTKNYALSQVD